MKQDELITFIRKQINPDRLEKLPIPLYLIAELQGRQEIISISEEHLGVPILKISYIFFEKVCSLSNVKDSLDVDSAYYLALCMWANHIYKQNKNVLKSAKNNIESYIYLLRDYQKVSQVGPSVLDNRLSDYKKLMAHMGILGASNTLFYNKRLKMSLVKYYQRSLTLEELKECLNNQILLLEEVSTLFKTKPNDTIILLLIYELLKTIERNSIVIEKMNNN